MPEKLKRKMTRKMTRKNTMLKLNIEKKKSTMLLVNDQSPTLTSDILE